MKKKRKNLKKVLDRIQKAWYTVKAVKNRQDAQARSLDKPTSFEKKIFKKVVDKAKAVW